MTNTKRSELLHHHVTPEVRVVITMMLGLLVPIVITLFMVRDVPAPVIATDVTPHGYTWSLTIFAVPLALLWYSLFWSPRRARLHVRAFWLTAITIPTLGCLLDFLFAHHILSFDNPSATLGVMLPAVDLSSVTLVPREVPVEEVGFYVAGSWFMLSLYVWIRERGFSMDNGRVIDVERPLLELSWAPAGLSAATVGLAFLIKRGVFFDHPHQEGFPLYALFLGGVFLFPTLLLFRRAKDYINVSATAIMLAAMLFISLMWEVTLGLPYGWWGYREWAMVGIFIPAWANIPVEAVFLWIVAGWGTVVSYEWNQVLFATLDARRAAGKS